MRTEVGLHMNFVSSLEICGAAMTCSVLHPLRNCEYGLFKECLWFLEALNEVSEASLVRGGAMGIFTYLCEMFNSPAVSLEILGAGIAKEPCCTGSLICAEACIFNLFYQVGVRFHRTWPIWKVSTLGTPVKEKWDEAMSLNMPRIPVPFARILEP